jgi:hypothetical protein
MKTKIELFDHAAECERQMRLAADPNKQVEFQFLRDMWITLAQASEYLAGARLWKEIKNIEKLQAESEQAALH